MNMNELTEDERKAVQEMRRKAEREQKGVAAVKAMREAVDGALAVNGYRVLNWNVDPAGEGGYSVRGTIAEVPERDGWTD